VKEEQVMDLVMEKDSVTESDSVMALESGSDSDLAKESDSVTEMVLVKDSVLESESDMMATVSSFYLVLYPLRWHKTWYSYSYAVCLQLQVQMLLILQVLQLLNLTFSSFMYLIN
jgi:hypothetical protein